MCFHFYTFLQNLVVRMFGEVLLLENKSKGLEVICLPGSKLSLQELKYVYRYLYLFLIESCLQLLQKHDVFQWRLSNLSTSDGKVRDHMQYIYDNKPVITHQF